MEAPWPPEITVSSPQSKGSSLSFHLGSEIFPLLLCHHLFVQKLPPDTHRSFLIDTIFTIYKQTQLIPTPQISMTLFPPSKSETHLTLSGILEGRTKDIWCLFLTH